MECFPSCRWEVCVGVRALWTRSLQVELVWPAEGLPLGQQPKAAVQELRAGHVAEKQVQEAPQEGAPQVPSGQRWLQGWPGGQALAPTGMPVTSAKPLGLLRLLLVTRALGYT